MKLKLMRSIFDENSTIGDLSIDDVYFCHTLEDKDRRLEDVGCSTKVPKETCIPRGTYEVTYDWSPHFNRKMPHINNVPCFDGIRIHVGNRPEDTEGCVLLGYVEGEDFISHSEDAWNDFLAKLLDGLNVGKVFIEIV
jgi:hypothetical protein